MGSGGISSSFLISSGKMEHIRVQKEQHNAAFPESHVKNCNTPRPIIG